MSAVAAEENGAQSELDDKKPPGILKTPQSFEDGIQHTVEPQMLDEEEPIIKYIGSFSLYNSLLYRECYDDSFRHFSQCFM